MRVYICTDHDTFYPIGGASVVVAPGPKTARKVLDAELIATGLKPFALEPYTLTEVTTKNTKAIILRDGNY